MSAEAVLPAAEAENQPSKGPLLSRLTLPLTIDDLTPLDERSPSSTPQSSNSDSLSVAVSLDAFNRSADGLAGDSVLQKLVDDLQPPDFESKSFDDIFFRRSVAKSPSTTSLSDSFGQGVQEDGHGEKQVAGFGSTIGLREGVSPKSADFSIADIGSSQSSATFFAPGTTSNRIGQASSISRGASRRSSGGGSQGARSSGVRSSGAVANGSGGLSSGGFSSAGTSASSKVITSDASAVGSFSSTAGVSGTSSTVSSAGNATSGLNAFAGGQSEAPYFERVGQLLTNDYIDDSHSFGVPNAQFFKFSFQDITGPEGVPDGIVNRLDQEADFDSYLSNLEAALAEANELVKFDPDELRSINMEFNDRVGPGGDREASVSFVSFYILEFPVKGFTLPENEIPETPTSDFRVY
ncbi:hypothetical protein [Rubripirellula reticaptiva]|uniref:hypothetical protein n=1 Tax=Rubripirellula reticaptiva TaxID=2528013 RepID=UPI0011B75A3A|nr:hypothetical protein [Rubripirellula reticaptiva]